MAVSCFGLICVLNFLRPAGSLWTTELHSNFAVGKSKERRRDRDAAAGNSTALSLQRWNVEAGMADIVLETQEDRQNGIVLQNCLVEFRISQYNMGDGHDDSTTVSNTLLFTCWIFSIVRQQNTKTV